jgi:hypothetical protein
MAAFVDQEMAPTGWGMGNYVEDTARDRGLPSEPPASLLPDLLDGARQPFSRRSVRMGRQAADRITEPQNGTENTEGPAPKW